MIRPAVDGEEQAHGLFSGPANLTGQTVQLTNTCKLRAPPTFDDVVPSLEFESGIDLLCARIPREGLDNRNAVQIKNPVQQILQQITTLLRIAVITRRFLELCQQQTTLLLERCFPFLPLPLHALPCNAIMLRFLPFLRFHQYADHLARFLNDSTSFVFIVSKVKGIPLRR